MTSHPDSIRAAGIDLPSLREWFKAEIPGFVPESAVQLAGGHSNITVKLSSGDGRSVVLRRPPLRSVLPTAHDMVREYRLISAFGPTNVPVPATLGFCTDASVTGAPFFVMEYVPGLVLNDQECALELDEPARGAAAMSLMDALAELHAANIDSIGLGDLARRDGYVARQLKRWLAQYEKTSTTDDVKVQNAHAILDARQPEQRGSTVVHGDFRLGNCIVDSDGGVLAVLDWEICTLGDPMADVGFVMATWPQGEVEAAAFPDSPSLAPGFPTRERLLERYAERSGRDVSQVDFYVAFSYFRLACILQGVYSRALEGAQGDTGDDLELMRTRAARVAALAEEATAAL